MELASWVYKHVYRFDHQNLETDLVLRCAFHSRLTFDAGPKSIEHQAQDTESKGSIVVLMEPFLPPCFPHALCRKVLFTVRNDIYMQDQGGGDIHRTVVMTAGS